MRHSLIVLIGFVVTLAATGQAMAERRVALVVGNAQYSHTFALPNPRNDAEDMSAVLSRLGFEVTVRYDLDQAGFARSLETFARAPYRPDVCLFFYTWHVPQIRQKNYLVP